MTRLQKIMAALEDTRPVCSYCAEHTTSRATVHIDGIDYPICSYAYPKTCGRDLKSLWTTKQPSIDHTSTKKETRMPQIGKIFYSLMQTLGRGIKSVFGLSSTKKRETLEDWTIRTLASSDETADYPKPTPCLVTYPCKDCGEFFHFDFYLDESNRRCSYCFDKFVGAELEKRVFTCSICNHDFWAKQSPVDSPVCPDCFPTLFYSYEDRGDSLPVKTVANWTSKPTQSYTCSVCDQDFLSTQPNNLPYITISPLCDDCELGESNPHYHLCMQHGCSNQSSACFSPDCSIIMWFCGTHKGNN